jgi:hypothetical protein
LTQAGLRGASTRRGGIASDFLKRAPRAEHERVEATVQQATAVNVTLRWLAAKASREALKLVDENASNVLPRCEPRISNLTLEQFYDACIKGDPTSGRKIENFSECPRRPGLCAWVLLHRAQTLELRDAIGVLEVSDEVDDRALAFPNIATQSPAKLLEEDAL